MITKRWKRMTDFSKGLFLGSCLLFLGIVTYYAPEIYAQVTLFNGLSESISTLADGDILGANDADDSNQMKQVLASTVKTYTSSAPTITGVATFSGTTRYSVDAGVSATGTGQGDGYDITDNVVQVTTITAASAEAVVLPTAAAGAWCFIINDDATDGLKIFPASGDDLGAGVDTVRATDLAAGSNVTFRAYDATNWEEIASGGATTSGSNNQLLTDDGAGGIVSESSWEISGNNLTAQSGAILTVNATNLHLRQDDSNQVIWSVDTTNEAPRFSYRDGASDIAGWKVFYRGTTANSTPTVITNSAAGSIPVGSSEAINFRCEVIARDQTSGDIGSYVVQGTVENAGGTTAILGSNTLTVLHEDDASWTVDLVADDGDDELDVQVTGDATNTVTWVAVVNTVVIMD